MNHDFAHCSDCTDECPDYCFRAQLVRDLKPGDIVAWVHLKDTIHCIMKRDCENCKFRLELEMWDYKKIGEGQWKEKPEGFICIAHACEGTAVWMVGLEHGTCEMWQRRIDGVEDVH